MNLCLDFTPERQFVTAHLLKTLAADTTGEICHIFLSGFLAEILALCFGLNSRLCHVGVVIGVHIFPGSLVCLCLAYAQAVGLSVYHTVRFFVNDFSDRIGCMGVHLG